MAREKSDFRICVVGAGPAGLAAAYFLRKRGYSRVTVLEKLGRVGGLCSSMTWGGASFDLGANYVTWAYTEVRQLAQELGAPLFTEGRLRSFNTEEETFEPLMRAATRGTSFWKVASAAFRFLVRRIWLTRLISTKRPGFKDISQHPDLTIPFSEWLKKHDLSALTTMLEIPITLMGYGKLDQIPTAYALSYMSPKTFINLGWAATGLPKTWPKRFQHGFQRMFERIAWQLDVRLDVSIEHIERGETVKVHFSAKEQILDRQRKIQEVLEFDKLILACPLTIDVLSQLFGDELSVEEKRLSDEILINPYSLTSWDSSNLEDVSAVTYLLPVGEVGETYVVTRQFEDNNLLEFYTRLDREGTLKKEDVLASCHVTAKKMGGELVGHYVTYDNWPYFPHVSSAAMQRGFYQDLESLQGTRNTFYTGGLLSFELVENVVAYSKHMVEHFFPNRKKPNLWPVFWFGMLVIGLFALWLRFFLTGSASVPFI